MSAPNPPTRRSLFRLRGGLILGRPPVTRERPTRLGATPAAERQRAALALARATTPANDGPRAGSLEQERRSALIKIKLRFDPTARLYWCSLDGGPSLPGFSLFEAILAAGYDCAAPGSTELHPEIEVWAAQESERLAERVAQVLGSGGHSVGGAR